jgi:hypothetical protein
VEIVHKYNLKEILFYVLCLHLQMDLFSYGREIHFFPKMLTPGQNYFTNLWCIRIYPGIVTVFLFPRIETVLKRPTIRKRLREVLKNGFQECPKKLYEHWKKFF